MISLDIPRLETERLILRGWSEETDFQPLLEMTRDENSMRYLGGAGDEFQTWRRMASMTGHWVLRGFGLWSLEEKASGAWVGYCGHIFSRTWPEKEIGWGLHPDQTGKGFATEAAFAARDHAYNQLGWTTAISLIDPRNKGSEGVATRLGAKPEREITFFDTLTNVWRHPAPQEVA